MKTIIIATIIIALIATTLSLIAILITLDEPTEQNNEQANNLQQLIDNYSRNI